MRLYWLRHGIAADRESWSGEDADRPLTPDGRKSMEREAKSIAALDLQLERIITSPLKRAKETAQIVADRLPDAKLSEDQRLAGLNRQRLSALLTEHRGTDSLLLVGHEPDFSSTISEITGGSQIVVKKGGLARVDLTDPSALDGELVWLIPPKVLTR